MVLRIAFLFFISWLIWGYSPIAAQAIKVRGTFLEDTTRVGEELRYALTARYPQELQLLFPDSSADFNSFEYVRKKYFTTKTVDSLSYDSVIYALKTFDLNEVQTLCLPVYVVHKSDCTVFYAISDTILFKSSLPAEIDTISFDKLPLMESVNYQPVPTDINYPAIWIWVGISLSILAIMWSVFGERIKKYYTLKRINKNHKKFLETYSSQLTKLKHASTVETAESTVGIWKKYMEDLERLPFTKLTTKETIQIVKDEALIQNLKSIDRSIYGSHPVTETPFEGLQRFAEGMYHKRIEEVKNG